MPKVDSLVPKVDSLVDNSDNSCRLLIVPLFRGSSRFESLILLHYFMFTCEYNKEETKDDKDDNYASIVNFGWCQLRVVFKISSLQLSDANVYEP